MKAVATFFEENKNDGNARALVDLLTRQVYWSSQLPGEILMNACSLVECAYRFLRKKSLIAVHNSMVEGKCACRFSQGKGKKSFLQQGLEFFLGRKEVEKKFSSVLPLVDKEFSKELSGEEFSEELAKLIWKVIKKRNEIAHGNHSDEWDGGVYHTVPIIYCCVTHALLTKLFELPADHLVCEYSRRPLLGTIGRRF